MSRHSGSARDPLGGAEASRIGATPGAALVVALLALMLGAAAVSGLMPGVPERVAQLLSGVG